MEYVTSQDLDDTRCTTTDVMRMYIYIIDYIYIYIFAKYMYIYRYVDIKISIHQIIYLSISLVYDISL